MLASLTRLQAIVLIICIALLAAWSLTVGPGVTGTAITGDGKHTDVQLYTDIANAVAKGEPYHHAAVRLQRAQGFPTSPFVTVRLPTLAWIEAGLGWKLTSLLLSALLAATALVWFAALRPIGSMAERLAAPLLILAGGAMATVPGLVVSHELWSGMFVALATALLMRGAWKPAIVAGACAILIRELAVPFVLIAMIAALWDRRRPEAASWALLLLAYAGILWLHRQAVVPLSLPTDPRSAGWHGFRGPGPVLQDISEATLIHLLPLRIAHLIALFSLIGFLGAPRNLARLAIPWLGTIAVLLAVFARPVNFYWAILTVPMIAVGLAFLPRMAMDLTRAIKHPR